MYIEWGRFGGQLGKGFQQPRAQGELQRRACFSPQVVQLNLGDFLDYCLGPTLR
jgi:hypothetical protein